MPFENRFTIRQELPTTYRLVGSGDDLRTAKQKVQTKNTSAKVAAPAPLKKPLEERGESIQGSIIPSDPVMTPEKFAKSSTMAELGNRLVTGTFAGKGSILDPVGLVGGAVGRAVQYVAYEGRQRGVDTKDLQSKIDQRVGQERSRFSQASQEARETKAAMAQATRNPAQNVSTGARAAIDAEAAMGGRGGFSTGPNGLPDNF